jgi:hypothetical protein
VAQQWPLLLPGAPTQKIGSAKVPESASEAAAAPSLSGGVPSMSAGLSLSGEIPGAGIRISSSSQMEGLNKSCVDTQWGRFVARSEPGEGVSCLVLPQEDMVDVETIELLLQLPNLMSVCCHVGVTIVQLSHDLVDDKLRVAAYKKPLNPMFSGDAQAIDKCLVFCHIVGCAAVQWNHIEKSISPRRDQHCASPGPVEGERAIEICAPVLLGDRGGLLSLSPFRHKIRQGLGLNRYLGDICYVEPHELECPLGNPPRCKTVLDNFPSPYEVTTRIGWLSE